MVQVVLHPFDPDESPLSHSSEACFLPSPHTISQLSLLEDGDLPSVMHRVHVSATDGDPPEQLYPSSIVQVALQPSKLDVSPSSHSSVLCFRPSPHIASQVDLSALCFLPSADQSVQVSTEDIVPPEQAKFVSIIHKTSHPSPGVVSPSSHCSVLCFMLSPHLASQLYLSAL